MYKVVSKRKLNENTYLMDIEAHRIAKSANPGQFVIIKIDEKGERIPLTIADYNKESGTVSIVFQIVGEGTKELGELNKGDFVMDFVGPLGHPSDFINENIEELKKESMIFIAGGVGAAPVYPQVKYLKEHGVDVDVIIGARSKDILILEEEMRKVAKNLFICTDDGSYGFDGRVTDYLEKIVSEGKKYNQAVIIGPMIMMKFTSMLTKKLNIKTIVSLNPIMVDGTGMCGACRVTVGGEIKFACVDGPEFDGHLVDFDEAMRRQTIYKTEEGRAMLEVVEGDTHHGGCGQCGGDK